MPKIVDREEMRGGILDAAMAVFTTRGYHAATIAHVAETAGLGKGTLYLYFKNKDAIAEAMVERHFLGMEARFMIDAKPKNLSTFIVSLEQSMGVPEEHANFIRVFFEVFGPSFASDSFTSMVSSFFEKLGTRYAQALEHLQKQGDVRADLDARLLGRSLASTVDGMILHRSLFGISKPRYAKMRREVLEMATKGIATS